jgi:hypothetical protein
LTLAATAAEGYPAREWGVGTSIAPELRWFSYPGDVRGEMMLLTALRTGAIAVLAFVLVVAAAAKLRRTSPTAKGPRRKGSVPIASTQSLGAARVLALVEFIVGACALAAPARVSGFAVAVLFLGFALAHARSWRSAGGVGCRCFGEQGDELPSRGRQLGLTAVSGAIAAMVGVAGAPSLARLAVSDPGLGATVALVASLVAACWRLVFSSTAAPATVGDRLVTSSALFLERRFSRRTLLLRVAVAGSALSVAPLRYLLYPGSALAAISPTTCADGLCTDGWTAFCCEINDGLNSCPADTYPAGWWMCTDYAGHQLCSEQGVRYYVDCNRLPGRHFPGGCHCANDSCANRRVACNMFRYGQCNTQIGGVTEVVCRMVVCENPSSIRHLNCSSSLAIDDLVCGHEAPCLEPPAVELAGAGGV